MPEPDLCFVLGTGRCGSTLVHEVLARHPGIGFVSNLEDNLPMLNLSGRGNGLVFRRLPASLQVKGRLRYAPSEAYRLMDRQVAPVISEPCRDLTAQDVTPWLAERFRKFFESRARAQQAPVFLHKFTGWPRARFIHRVFPEAKFIHIVRDGRAVANSWLQMDWWRGYQGPEGWQWGPLPEAYRAEWEASGRSFVLLAGLAWKMLMDAYEEARSEIPPDRWLQIRHEEVVDDSRSRIGEMLEFLGLEWDEEFEAGFARYRFAGGRTAAFTRDLDPEALSLLNGSLAGHLARHGYTGEMAG